MMRRVRSTLGAVLASASVAAAGTQGPAPVPPAAAEQARLCLALAREPGVEACRRALQAGLDHGREAAFRQVLAGKLAGLKRWDEVAAVYAEAARLAPRDPTAHLRLGSALLFLDGRAAEAAISLREAVRLDPEDAQAHGTLGVALSALGQLEEAAAELQEAVRLDHEYLEARPASRQVLEAARLGRSWP